jgi:hypothetical protein
MDPYLKNLKKRAPKCNKIDIYGSFVVVLSSYQKKRNLQLIQQSTRVVLINEVHEIIITDEKTAEPGNTVDNIAYFGFVEFTNSGVLMYGDSVKVDNSEIGKLVGFDYTHMPNHMNIILRSSKINSGEKHGIHLGDIITFTH